MRVCIALAGLWCAVGQPVRPVVETQFGKVRGRFSLDTGTEYFWGIPYAAPPVGGLRFAPPTEPSAWNTTLDTPLIPPPTCPQLHATDRIIIGQEDCLTLDVYRPTLRVPGELLPVMVWIYGGAFVFGSADMLNKYNGKELARKHRVIVVAMNYRVNNLGFLALRELLHEHGTTGNYGLLDQQFAMRWVQGNIRHFGGDPQRVMLYGQSAGGCSVIGHLAMPASRGLFHSAVAESPLSVSDIAWISLRNATAFGEFYAQQVGCPANVTGGQLPCLRSMALRDILNPLLEWRTHLPAAALPLLPRLMPLMPWWPTIDGTTLPDTPIELARQARLADVPFIVGTVHDEGSIFVPLMPAIVHSKPPVVYPLTYEGTLDTLAQFFNSTVARAIVKQYGLTKPPTVPYTQLAQQLVRDFFFVCPARHLLRSMARRRAPTWTYHFQQKMNSETYKVLGDFHASEIRYVFGLKADWWTADDERLSHVMSSYWTNLAATGQPRCAGCPEWREYHVSPDGSDEYMLFATPTEMKNNLLHDMCDFWDHWGYTNNP